MAPYDEYPDDRGFRYLTAFLDSIVVAMLWVPAAIVRHASRSFRQFGAESWPRANGAVTAVNVKVIHGWVVDYAIGRLDYSYRLAGQYYAGSISWQFPDEQAAWSFVDARRDKPVIVRYKDNNAEASVLIEADQQPVGAKSATLDSSRWCGTTGAMKSGRSKNPTNRAKLPGPNEVSTHECAQKPLIRVPKGAYLSIIFWSE